VMVLALGLSFLLKEIPLRTEAHVRGVAELGSELGHADEDRAEAGFDGHAARTVRGGEE